MYSDLTLMLKNTKVIKKMGTKPHLLVVFAYPTIPL